MVRQYNYAMKTLIVLVAFFTSVAHAQIIVQTQQYHEVNIRRLTVNPYPPSYYQSLRNNNPKQRTIVIVPTTKIIQTGPLTVQDQQLIELIK